MCEMSAATVSLYFCFEDSSGAAESLVSWFIYLYLFFVVETVFSKKKRKEKKSVTNIDNDSVRRSQETWKSFQRRFGGYRWDGHM